MRPDILIDRLKWNQKTDEYITVLQRHRFTIREFNGKTKFEKAITKAIEKDSISGYIALTKHSLHVIMDNQVANIIIELRDGKIQARNHVDKEDEKPMDIVTLGTL